MRLPAVTRTASVPPPWVEFFSWPEGASLLYLISAACLLAGVSLVLAPGAGIEERIPERLTLFGTVLIYTGSLLGTACLVCHWRRDHEDAVALSVLLALFSIAAAAPLDVLVTQFPILVGLLSALTLAAVLACVRVWTRRVGGPLPAPVALGGGLLVLGAFAAPTFLALGIAHLGRPDPQALLGWWQAIDGVTCLGLSVLWLGCLHAPWQSDWPRCSRIQSRPLRWMLAAVVSLAAITQTWLASYTVCLGLEPADLLLPLVLVALFLDALGERHLGFTTSQRVLFWAGLSLLPLLLVGAGSVDPLAAPLTHPALAIGLGAGGVAWAAWRAADRSLALIAAGWAIIAIAGIGTWVEQPTLHMHAAGAALVMAMAAIAGLTRQPGWALCTSLVATLGFYHFMHPAPPLLVLILGGQILAWHLVFGARLNLVVVAIGAALVAMALGTGSHVYGIENPYWLSLLSLMLMLPGLAYRRTRSLALLPLALPLTLQLTLQLAGHLSALLCQHPAWCAIGSAFVLLGIGAWRSHHTAHQS